MTTTLKSRSGLHHKGIVAKQDQEKKNECRKKLKEANDREQTSIRLRCYCKTTTKTKPRLKSAELLIAVRIIQDLYDLLKKCFIFYVLIHELGCLRGWLQHLPI